MLESPHSRSSFFSVSTGVNFTEALRTANSASKNDAFAGQFANVKIRWSALGLRL